MMGLEFIVLSSIVALIFYLIISIVVGIAAHSRGRGPFAWFLISLLLSPVLALLLLLVFPAKPRSRTKDDYDDAELYRNIRCNRSEPTF